MSWKYVIKEESNKFNVLLFLFEFYSYLKCERIFTGNLFLKKEKKTFLWIDEINILVTQ